MLLALRFWTSLLPRNRKVTMNVMEIPRALVQSNESRNVGLRSKYWQKFYNKRASSIQMIFNHFYNNLMHHVGEDVPSTTENRGITLLLQQRFGISYQEVPSTERNVPLILGARLVVEFK